MVLPARMACGSAADPPRRLQPLVPRPAPPALPVRLKPPSPRGAARAVRRRRHPPPPPAPASCPALSSDAARPLRRPGRWSWRASSTRPGPARVGRSGRAGSRVRRPRRWGYREGLLRVRSVGRGQPPVWPSCGRMLANGNGPCRRHIMTVCHSHSGSCSPTNDPILLSDAAVALPEPSARRQVWRRSGGMILRPPCVPPPLACPQPKTARDAVVAQRGIGWGRARGRAPHRAWGRADAGVHARRHGRHGEGDDGGRRAGDRRQPGAGQHLSPDAAAGRGAGGGPSAACTASWTGPAPS